MMRFGQFLSPDQMADLLLTVVESLKEANESTIEASKTILNVILEKYKQKIQMEVPKIVDRIHSQLRAIHHSHARQVVMMALCLLARAFMEEVSTALLKCPLPLDKDAAGMWRTLANTEASCHCHRLLDMLLKELQERPSTSEDRAFIIPLAGPSRLAPASIVRGCVVKTMKTLLLKMGCHYEFTSVEKVGGWELLTSSEEHHRGVGLLARAMVHYSCCQLWRILYLLVPFLERGDKQHKLTAMAFFVELLHMPQAKRLPEKYSMLRLLKGLTDPDPVIRALCVKGLITMADWPGKIKVLVPAMINSLFGVDGRLVVEALADVKKILRGLDVASYVGCITSPLRLLFDDVRQRGVLLFTIKTPVFLTSSVCVCLSRERMSVRSAAISLFGKMVKKVMKSQGLMKEEDVLDSLIPLPLHLQEGNPDMAESTLGGLMHDPEASVCIFAAQARERVLAVSWKVKYGLVEQHKVNSDSAEKHKSPPNPPATESTSSRLFNALNLWKLAAKH
nr:maestro heat-like repeat-containing protein family member 7 [Chrysemys picta bellii]